MSGPGLSAYDVRVWSIRTYKGKRGTSYNVRWRVGATSHGRTFGTKKLAESFHAEILTAYRKGESFKLSSGLPSRMERTVRDRTWYEHACDFIDMKWPHASPRHRKSLAEALTGLTVALVSADRGAPPADELRRALFSWSFNSGARAGQPAVDAAPPEDFVRPLRWVTSRSLPLSSLSDPTVLRRALHSVSLKLDGTAAAPATVSRKRSALYSALQYAVELNELPLNPMDKLKVKRAPHTDSIDRRVVVNRRQAKALLAVVRNSYPALEAFFACLYYAGLRPAEARHLRVSDCRLPSSGWGELLLLGSTQQAGSAWTDSGRANEDRGLKHRAVRDTRAVPAHPELVAILRRHLERFEPSPDGRLFVSRSGPGGRLLSAPFSRPLPMGTVYRAWQMARRTALTPEQVASPLARRPYDLRHACLSTWLNAGVSPAQVAEWAGHSVNVLLRVYAKCVYGQQESALRKIEAALLDDDKAPGR